MSVAKNKPYNNNEASGFSVDKKWTLCMVASFLWCLLLTMRLDYTDGGALTFWGFGSSSTSAINISTTLSQSNDTHRATSTLVAAAASGGGSLSDYSNSSSSGIIVPEIESDKTSNNHDHDTVSGDDHSTDLQILQSSKSSGQGGKILRGNNEEYYRNSSSNNSNNNSFSGFTVAEILLLPPNYSIQSGVEITEQVIRKEDSSSNNSTGEVAIPTADSLPPPSIFNNQSNMIIIEVEQAVKKEETCNMFEGAWVHDDRPVYYAEQCPFLSGQVSCRRNGRPDSDYENWIWETKGCQIPRFNGTDMLERLRGKRMIIVGDSLNRNQWESLACLLYSSIRDPSRRAYVNAKSNVYKVFRSMDYKCSVEFYWNPFLVKLEANQEGKKVLKLDKIAESAKRWKGADIMVFNTGHWWVHRGKMQAWDEFQYKGRRVDIEVEWAMELALKTWSMWLHRNVDKSKTTVFFRSISPEHKGKFQCDNTTELIRDESYRFDFPRKTLNVVEQRIRKLGTKVKYLNITKLSSYRQDGHPSVYARKDGIKPEDRLPTYSDCSHWCLPGLPDTWNRLVYAHMVLINTSRDISL